MLRWVGYIQEFTNLLRTFRISPLRPASGYLTPIGVDERKTKTKENQKMVSTKDVVDHHLKCFGEQDLKGILSDYAPGAVLFTPDGPLRGADAIKPLFQAMIAEFGKPGAMFSMKQQFVEGDYAYILWTAETADNVYEVGTDTFVVREGKIITQSFAGKITPKG
jgi:ketosteroid isomerase-like protein